MSTTKDCKYNFLEIIDRLKEISGNAKQFEIARLLGFDKDTFAARKARDSVPVREIKLACVSRGWSSDWVLKGEGDVKAVVNPKYKQFSTQPQAEQDRHDYGLTTDIRHLAGAGDPRVSSGEVVISVMLPADFTKPGIVPVMVKGNSMMPVFLDGSIVGVDTSDREYLAGRYYAVWMDDEGAMIKKLSSERDRIFVESLNKDEHSFYVNKSEVRDHFILGRVKWWINQEG